MYHWLFSQVDVEFKANISGNALRFETLLCSFGLILVRGTDKWCWNCSANFIWDKLKMHLGFQIFFFQKWLLCLLFCKCLFTTVAQSRIVRQQHLNSSLIASAPNVDKFRYECNWFLFRISVTFYCKRNTVNFSYFYFKFNLLDKLSHNYRILSRIVSELVFIVAAIVLPHSIYPNIKGK